jgi:UDP-GlcNAc:undecaprenyl-phosphate GlcNAc-1-phosphate transferase
VVLTQPFLALYPLGLAVGAVLAALLTPLAGRLAHRAGIVAAPRPDRWHSSPTPMLGGVAIFLAVAVAFALIPEPMQQNRYERFAYLLVGAVMIFLLGLYDDARRLPPYTKLLFQIVTACVLVFGQLHLFGRPDISPLLVPFAILWIVGVTNAFNLLDNMDGLAAGIAVVVGITVAASSYLQGDRQTTLVALIVAGAAAGFLVHNFNPARIFMGDCGSLLLGYLLSGLTVMGAASSTRGIAVTLVIPVVVMALPILDTSLVTILRTLHGRSISQGGRDHLSHRLVALGLSERQAVLVLYLVAALAGGLVVASGLVETLPMLALWLLSLVALVLFGIYLGQVRIYTETEFRQMGGTSRVVGRLVLGGRYVLYKQQVASLLLDLLLVMAALLGAYLIRFEGRLDPLFVSQFARLVTLAVSLKLAAFLSLGVYRSLWRHMGLADVWQVVLASAVGSLLTVVVAALLFGIGSLPLSVLFIDWLLFTPLVIGTRYSFELMQHLVSQGRSRDVTRVLIAGAGDAGELALRALQRSRHRSFRAVGFLDDDQAYRNRTIHGVRVLGQLDGLAATIEGQAVDEVVIAVADDEQAARVLRLCAELGLPARDLAAVVKSELHAGAAAAQA